MLRMWMLDVAREQSPTLDHLRRYAQLSVESGFDALGLYLEHRFAYRSTPWSHGAGCISPEVITAMQSEFPQLQIVPFVNLLGHFEGMLYTEHGKRFREGRFQGMQACPCNPDFLALCRQLIDDTVATFSSELIHIGGDETWQLGQCDLCKIKVQEFEQNGSPDGKAELYGEHFGPLAQYVVDLGRRPAVWADMFKDHPSALAHLPKETLLFDWQYFNGIAESAKAFVDAGFDVVGCPALHTYNATWLHLDQSEQNVREVCRDVKAMIARGVCVTTWENGLFGSYDTLFPALRACGDLLNGKETTFGSAYGAESQSLGEWAVLMGRTLQEAGGTFAFDRIRSSLKVRLLLNANPFLAWLHHAEELSGPVGDRALEICDEGLRVAPDEATKGISLFGRSAIEFVRIAEASRQLYADGQAEAAAAKLAITRRIFEDLENVAKRTHARIGGSLADLERCRAAKRHIETVVYRIRHYGDGSLGYLPAFEHLTHPKFMPHDQAAWWLINRWANE
jgi:hypothetical protein